MAATKKKRFEPGPGLLQCTVCKRVLPTDKFISLTRTDVRCKPGHSWSGWSSDCRECRIEYKREARRKKAEAAGRTFIAHEDRAARKAEREAASAASRANYEAEFARRRTPEELERRRRKQVVRIVKRQRWRYNNDPAYHAKVKAKKLRRKHAIAITRVEAVNREVVAQRDGWCCGICQKKVTRETWSMDHITPLSRGGSHTYGNVVLTHLLCNLARGAGGTGRRLSVQAPLFPTLVIEKRAA